MAVNDKVILFRVYQNPVSSEVLLEQAEAWETAFSFQLKHTSPGFNNRLTFHKMELEAFGICFTAAAAIDYYERGLEHNVANTESALQKIRSEQHNWLVNIKPRLQAIKTR